MISAAKESGRYRPTGYKMIRSIQIRNFRSFKDVKIDKCSRINILVGDNGSGKTAMLEALFLAAGLSPEIALRTKSWRGAGGRMSGSHEDVHQALWADLFYNFNTKQPALVSLKGTDEHTRSVNVKLNPVGHVRVVPPSRKRPGAPVRVEPDPSPIEFKWKIRGFPRDVTISPYFEEEKLVIPPVPASSIKASFFAANQTPSGLEVANRFSQLSRTFREDEFVSMFNQLFPNIKGLSVELSAGAPMLFAWVDGISEKIPLSLASGGMHKLASIILAITSQPGGVILIDEIENGFYYKRMSAIWKTVLEFAAAYDCQLFVSSHSSECLEAVAELAEINPDDFCLMRTILEPDGTKVRRFNGNRFASAVLDEIEVR